MFWCPINIGSVDELNTVDHISFHCNVRRAAHVPLVECSQILHIIILKTVCFQKNSFLCPLVFTKNLAVARDILTKLASGTWACDTRWTTLKMFSGGLLAIKLMGVQIVWLY